MSEHLLMALVLPTLFLTSGYVVISIARAVGKARSDRYAAEVHSKLLDRLGSGQEVLQFMQSEAGQKLMAGEREVGSNHAGRLLNSIQTGMVALCAGIGMCAVSGVAGEGSQFLRVAGGILIAVGIGIGLSAVWSYWLLKKWGLVIERKSE